MDLTAKDAARLLKVDEETIREWIENGTIPSYRVGDKTRLNRVELMEWAAERKHSVNPRMFHANGTKPSKFVLSDAVRRGGILYDMPCTDKLSALSAACRAIPLPDDADREELKNVLVAREALCSTGIGNGIAIPHPRGPIVLGVPGAQVTVAFPRVPIEFGSVDGKPVHTMFVIVSTTVRIHLILLSHLMFALRSEPFVKLLADRAQQDAILAALQQIEDNLSDTDSQGDKPR